MCDERNQRNDVMGIIWTIIIGFVAGLIAKFLHPGPNEPAGFILTTLLGIAGLIALGPAIAVLYWREPDPVPLFKIRVPQARVVRR